jgi:hypothetical protein
VTGYQLVEDGRLVTLKDLSAGDRFKIVGDPGFNPETVRIFVSFIDGVATLESEANRLRWRRGLPGMDDDAEYRLRPVCTE